MEASEHSTPVSHPANVIGGHELNEDLDDTLQHIIMAVDFQLRNKLGCAYYIAREAKLCVMEDMADASPDLLANCERNILGDKTDHFTVKLEIQPTILFVSTRLEEVFGPHREMNLRESSLVHNGRCLSCFILY